MANPTVIEMAANWLVNTDQLNRVKVVHNDGSSLLASQKSSVIFWSVDKLESKHYRNMLDYMRKRGSIFDDYTNIFDIGGKRVFMAIVMTSLFKSSEEIQSEIESILDEYLDVIIVS